MARSKYFKKLLIIILMTSMLPVIVLSIYTVIQNNINLREKVNETNLSLLSKTQSSVEETLQFIQSYYTLLTLYDGLSEWTGAKIDYSNVQSISELQKRFNGGIITYDVIKEVSLINAQQDWVISQSKVSTFSHIEDYEEILSLIQTGSKIFWQFIGQTYIDKNDLLKGDICLVIKAGASFMNESQLIMIVTISNYQFDQMMRKNNYGYPVMVMDENGVVVYAPQKDNIGKKYNEISYLQGFDYEHADERGSFKDSQSGTYINFVRSQFNNFIYISTYTDSDIRSASDSIVDYTLIIGSILTMILLILTFLETRFIYQPIQKVVQGFTQKTMDGSYKDEFDMINHNIKELLSTNADLQLELAQYEPVLEELFLMKIIEGQASSKNIEETAKELRIYDKWVYMIIMVIQMESNASRSIDNDIMLLESCHIASTIIPEDLRLKSIISHGKGVFLVGGRQEMLESFMETLYGYGQTISAKVREIMDIDITIGMSTVFCEFEYAQKAYRESHNVLIYKSFLASELNTDNENILFFDHLKPDAECESEYPKELVSGLASAISNLDEALVNEKLNQVMKAIYSHKNIINEFQFYLLRLTADIILILDVGHHYHKIFNSQATIFEELNKITKQSDMRSFFYEKLIRSIMETIREHGTPQDLIIEKVIQIIHNEYMTDLSIEICAERLNYHPTYIWRVMKSKLNTTFQDYLIHYRMQMAEKWLMETDMTVAEIAARLRYNNSQNFIRTFKKVVGTTPGKYRNQ